MSNSLLRMTLLCVLACNLCSQQSMVCAQISPPPGLHLDDIRVVDPDSPAGSRAHMPLEEVLQTLVAMDQPPSEDTAPPISEAAAIEAVRLYASGRAKAMRGLTLDAARDLSEASKLDPTSAPPHRALGELLLGQGMIPAGLSAYQRAVAAGADTPSVILDVASELLRGGQTERAAVLLARGLNSSEARDTASFARPMLLDRLQEALERLGWLRASIDAGIESFEQLEELDPARRNATVARLLRGLPSRWTALGHAAQRLGEEELSADLYDRAAAAGADWTTLTPRRAYAHLESGDGAGALEAVLPKDQPQRLASGMTVDLLHWLREQGVSGALLRERVEAAANSMQEPTPMLNARIMLARAAVMDEPRATETLREGLAQTPAHRGLAYAIVDRAEQLSDLIPSVQASPMAARSLMDAWLDRRGKDHSAIEALLRETPAHRALIAAGWLELGRADMASDVLLASIDRDQANGANGAEAADLHEQFLVLTAEAFAGDGRWELVQTAYDRLQNPADKATVLLVAQRLEELDAMLPPVLRSTHDEGDEQHEKDQQETEAQASIDPLLAHAAAQAALIRGDLNRAAQIYDIILEADAYDTNALRALVSIRMPGGPAAEPRAFEAALAALRAAEPSDDVVVQMETRLLASQQGAEQALNRILPQLEGTPSLSATAVEVGAAATPAQRERVRDELLRLHELHPRDSRVLVPLALVLTQLGAGETAATLLSGFEGKDESVAEFHESLLSEQLRQGERARQMRIDRLSSGPASISRTLRLAELLAGQDPKRAGDLITASIPSGVHLTPAQNTSLIRAILAIGQSAEQTRSAETAQLTLQALETADSINAVVPWQIRLLEFSTLLISGRTDAESVERVVRLMTGSIESQSDALALAQRYRGTRADVGDTITQGRAEVAYALAGALYFEGHEEASLAVYRLALEYDPNNVWANNDLGYFMLERGEQLAEAASLIERAYQLRPDEINIIDSMGWLRYKQQRLEDGEYGQGAVSIFEAALATPEGAENDTIQDHAGDVFWVAGRRDDAVKAWTVAAKLLDELLAQFPAGSEAAQRFIDQRAKLADKLQAAEQGNPPAVEPFGDP
jgi:tetratricopeptide (TPR) repeat protein